MDAKDVLAGIRDGSLLPKHPKGTDSSPEDEGFGDIDHALVIQAHLDEAALSAHSKDSQMSPLPAAKSIKIGLK